jgi:hypothetical protein
MAKINFKLTLIWKSKGTRKSIEFILKFIGAPIGLTFNEYIYKGDGPIDIDLFKKSSTKWFR